MKDCAPWSLLVRYILFRAGDATHQYSFDGEISWKSTTLKTKETGEQN
jgi:hypothetical protein